MEPAFMNNSMSQRQGRQRLQHLRGRPHQEGIPLANFEGWTDLGTDQGYINSPSVPTANAIVRRRAFPGSPTTMSWEVGPGYQPSGRAGHFEPSASISGDQFTSSYSSRPINRGNSSDHLTGQSEEATGFSQTEYDRTWQTETVSWSESFQPQLELQNKDVWNIPFQGDVLTGVGGPSKSCFRGLSTLYL